MSVYVGIDVHRKRSQVAVIDQDGKVLANRNVNNGVQPILSVIGGLLLAPDHRPPLAGIKLVRPRPRLPARRCGRSSLTPERARQQKTGSDEEKPQPKSTPTPAATRTGHRVNSVRPLDNSGPHGCGHSRL
jgi:hypothetical protein